MQREFLFDPDAVSADFETHREEGSLGRVADGFPGKAWRRDMRITPKESATLTTAGSPSGTAATARLMDVMVNSKKGTPRHTPRPNNRATIPRAAHSRTGYGPRH